MYQPQLIEVDPQRIKFSALNPRKHGGDEFARLKQSIQEIGIVQMPIVRTLPGGFYEVIDGEGRVKAAQELHLPKIMVTSLGVVNDQEALAMLVTSNVVRQFDFFARCRGMAALHRQGKTAEKISKELGIPYPGMTIRDMAIGYFPEEIYAVIHRCITAGEDKAQVWSNHKMLYELLPLRQVLPGKEPGNHDPLDGVYDYSEVQRAVEKIVKGEISNSAEMRAYVEQRRREMFEQNFNQELQQRLQAELAQTRQALEESTQQQMHDVEEKTKQRYAAQVAVLQEQLNDMEERHAKIVREVAKKPDEKKLIEQREKELREQVQKTEVERQRLQSLQYQMQEELKKTQQQTLEELRKKIDADLSEQRKAMKQEHDRAEADLKALYAKKDQERQLKAEESVRQMRAHGVELLAQTQQWILHITSPNMMHGLEWLDQAETVTLLAQIRSVRNILEEAEEKLRYGNAVPQTGTVIHEAPEERSLVRGK